MARRKPVPLAERKFGKTQSALIRLAEHFGEVKTPSENARIAARKLLDYGVFERPSRDTYTLSTRYKEATRGQERTGRLDW